MEKSCRTCLREKRLNQMKLLSSKWNNSTLSFADMLMDVVNINKNITSDKCSFRICSSCETDLITAYNFKIVCRNTEKILSEQYNEQAPLLWPSEGIKCEIIAKETSNDSKEFESNINENIEDFNDVYEHEEDIKIEKPDDNEIPKTESKIISNEKTKTVQKNIKNTKRKPTDSENNEKNVAKNVDKLKPSKIQRTKKTKSNPKVKTGKKRKNHYPCLYCRKCDIRFEMERQYRRHCEETHFESFPCTICGKLYLQNRIKTHMITHLTEKNYNCSICDGKYASNSKLKEHMRIHTGEKRYKCKFCDEVFLYWTSRKNHVIKEHTKEKRYECYLCHRLFALRGSMVMHIKYHLGDFNYPCSICDKRFINGCAVRRHELTHSKKGRRRVSTKPTVNKNAIQSYELVGNYSETSVAEHFNTDNNQIQ